MQPTVYYHCIVSLDNGAAFIGAGARTQPGAMHSTLHRLGAAGHSQPVARPLQTRVGPLNGHNRLIEQSPGAAPAPSSCNLFKDANKRTVQQLRQRRQPTAFRMAAVAASETVQSGMKTVEVDLGDRSYPIYIGSGLLEQGELLRQHIPGKRVLIVTNETIAPLYLDK